MLKSTDSEKALLAVSSSDTTENMDYRAYMYEEIIITALLVFSVTNLI